MHLVFREEHKNARVRFFEEDQLRFVSLSVANLKNWDREVFINLTGINQPKKVAFQARLIHWILRSPNNRTYEMEAFLEITYFNGTVYKNVIQPFQFTMLSHDDNDSFEAADEIKIGRLKAYIDEDFDPVDYYKV